METPKKSNLIFYHHVSFSTYFSHPSIKDWVAKHFHHDDHYQAVALDFRKDVYVIVQHKDPSDLSKPTRFFLCKTDYHLKTFSILYTSPDYVCEEYGQTTMDDFNGKIAFILFQSHLQVIDIEKGTVLMDEAKDDFVGGVYQGKDGKFVSLKQLPNENKSRLLVLKFNEGHVTKTFHEVYSSSVSLVGIVDDSVLYYTWHQEKPEAPETYRYYGFNYDDGQYIDEKRATKLGKKVNAYWYQKLFAYCVTIDHPAKGSVIINHPKKKRVITLTHDDLMDKNDYVRELSNSGFELCHGFYKDHHVFLVWGRRNNAVPLDSEDHISRYDDAKIFCYDLKNEVLSYMGYLDGLGADSISVFSRPKK